MNPRIPLAVFGLGWVFRNGYLPYLQNGPFEVVSVYDPNPGIASDVIRFLPRARVESSVEACLKSLASAALIASPNPTHYDLSLQALRAGLNVLCEKPVAMQQSQVQQLIQTEQQSCRRLAGAAVCRYRRDVQQWLRWSTPLLNIRRITLTWVRHNGVPSPGSWHTQSSDGWTGVLADLGYHLADLAVMLMNDRFKNLECHSATLTSSGRGSAATWYGLRSAVPYDVYDRVHSVVEVDGVLIELQASWVDDTQGDLTRLVVANDDERVELEGLFGFSNQRRIPIQQCRMLRNGRTVKSKSFPTDASLHRAAFREVLDDFADVCRGADPQVGLPQIEATAMLMEAIKQTGASA